MENNEKWETYIATNGKRIIIGLFSDLNCAIKNRLLAEKRLYGEEFSPQRHLFEIYGV